MKQIEASELKRLNELISGSIHDFLNDPLRRNLYHDYYLSLMQKYNVPKTHFINSVNGKIQIMRHYRK